MIIKCTISYRDLREMEVNQFHPVLIVLLLAISSLTVSTKQLLPGREEKGNVSHGPMAELRDALTDLERLLKIQEIEDMLKTDTPEYSGMQIS